MHISGQKRTDLLSLAVKMRRKGQSYPQIELALGVSRSTLSGWLSNLALSKRALNIILTRKQNHLKKVRVKANFVLKNAEDTRLKIVYNQVVSDLEKVNFSPSLKELLLVMLYLGEGFKKRSVIGLGNSNPKILAAFVNLVKEIYSPSDGIFRCYLHLRADQNEQKEKSYWSKILGVSKAQFRKSQFDNRTLGKKTWKGYHGVCAVYCYDARIEKRLTALQRVLLAKLVRGG